jgi:hypothetical protein
MKAKTAFKVLAGLTLGACLGLCVYALARADGLYVEGGVLALVNHGADGGGSVLVAVPMKSTDGSTHYTLEEKRFDRYWLYDINRVRNPYGTLAIGYDWRFTSFSLDLEARHQSSITVGDRGEDSVGLKLRWYPFGGSR